MEKIRFVTKISVLCETQVRVLWHDYSTHRVQYKKRDVGDVRAW